MHLSTIIVVIYLNYTLLCILPTKGDIRDFHLCHEDFSVNPPDGLISEHTFPWLGFTQYIQETSGLPHQTMAPRVVLIQKQFALGTALDLVHLPKNYKLGSVIFGDYLREEEECGLTREDIRSGTECVKAYIEIPIMDVTAHPEFSRFGVGNSIALVKMMRPIKSHYMMPVCLPSLTERLRKRNHRHVYLIDYMTSVPKDFVQERMGKKTLRMFTHSECIQHIKLKATTDGITHMLCSTGCAIRAGAPIISHSEYGQFELIGLAAGSGPCDSRSMRNKLNEEPAVYIDVYPYAGWIINVISAHIWPRAYPQRYQYTDGGLHLTIKNQVGEERSDWKGRVYVIGNVCFGSRKFRNEATFFYTETFEGQAETEEPLDVTIHVFAGAQCMITCVRIALPNRLCTPKVEGLGTQNISINFDSDTFPRQFRFTMAISGSNVTKSLLAKEI